MKKSIENLSSLDFRQVCDLFKLNIKTVEDLISYYINKETRLKLLNDIFSSDWLRLEYSINQAKLMKIKGINKLFLKLLNLTGVYNLTQLSEQNVFELNSRMIEINSKYLISKINRSDYVVQNWIDEAKELIKIEKENEKEIEKCMI